MLRNQKEIELLHSNPGELIVLYQDIVSIIVDKFVSSGSINISDRDEFIQIVNERLLLSAEKIKTQYKGISMLKTYFSSIIRNICLEELNKKRRQKFVDIEAEHKIPDTPYNDESYLQNEYDRLDKIFLLYHKKAPKLIFCLKVIYRLKVRITDFTRYCLKFSNKSIKELIEKVHPVHMTPEFELFEILTPYINKCDNQINKPDALRRWVKRKIDEITELMNGNPKRANYDKEAIQILIEKYYSKENGKIMSKSKP